MSDTDQSYYLKRALFHRRQLELAGCVEARLCHAQLVKAYQRRLADIRKQRPAGGLVVRSTRVTLSLFGSGGTDTRINETC